MRNNLNGKNAKGYQRVSIADQKDYGNSLSAQKKAMIFL